MAGGKDDPAASGTMKKSRSAPVVSKTSPSGLDDMGAFARTVNSSPSFTMRSKPAAAAGREVRPNVHSYTPGGVGHRGAMTAPSWSMTSRGSGISKPPQQPSPGDYALPGTIYGNHPTLPQPGRVPRTEARRSAPGEGAPAAGTPSPQDYDVLGPGGGAFGRPDQGRAPSYSMRARCAAPTQGSKERRPTVHSYTPGGVCHRGALTAPSWSMTSRGSGISKPPQQPGPGEYALPGTIYGNHPTVHQPGRVPQLTGKRSLPSDGLNQYPERPY